ncbi:MAG: glycosyltransferase family 39 protein [Acidobacteriota bacterium]
MSPTRPRLAHDDTGWMIAVGVVAVAAFALRIYALGTPEFLHDEGLVANAALRDWRYIFIRSWVEDAHPPFFYLLAKTILTFGSSSFLLRLPSVLAGTAAVLLLYRLGARLISRQAGLTACALLAVHLLHVELSRVLRPHALIMALAILSFLKLLDFLDKPDRRNLILLVLVNFALLLLHFNSILIVGAEFVIIAAHALVRRGPLVKAGLALCALTAASMGVNAVFLLRRLNNFPGVQVNVPMLWTLNRTLENLYNLLSVLPFSWAGYLGIALFALGAWRLAPQPRVLAMLLGMICLPLLVLILARYGIIYHETHIAFILPFLLLVCAAGLASLTRLPRLAAACILLSGTVLLASEKHQDVYAPDAILFGGGGSFSQGEVARLISRPGDVPVVAVTEPSWLMDFVNWHYRRQHGVSLSANAIAPGDEFVDYVTFLAQDGESAGLGVPAGVPVSSESIRGVTLSRWILPRSPVRKVMELPARVVFAPDPESFFPYVLETTGLSARLSPLGNRLCPSEHGSEGSFTVRLSNASGRHAPNVLVEMNTTAMRQGDSLEVSYRFDDEPFQRAIGLGNPVGDGTISLHVRRDAPYATLDIRVRLASGRDSATFYNIPESPGFNGMTVSLSPADDQFDFEIPVVQSQIDAPEQSGDSRFRWGKGPESILLFATSSPEPVTLELDASSPIPAQRVEVLLNGSSAGALDLPHAGETGSLRLTLPCAAGSNVILLRYARWNHGDHADPAETFAPQESRTLAAAFTRLRLVAHNPQTRIFAYFKEYK